MRRIKSAYAIVRLARAAGLVALSSAVLLATAGSASAADKVRFILNWKPEGPNAPFYLAQQRGYFAKEGLDVTLDSGDGSGVVATRIGSGAYDAGFGDVNTMIQFDANFPDRRQMVVLMLYSKAPLAVITLAKSGITKPQDLVGRTVGAPQSDAGFQLFPTFAAATGLDASKVKFQNVAPNLRDALLAKGEVDAVTGYDSTSWFALKSYGVKQSDVRFLYYADYGVDVYSNSILVSAAFAEKSPRATAGLVRAIAHGWIDALRKPEAAIDSLVKHEPLVNREIELEKLKWVIERQIVTAATRAGGLGAVDTKRLDHAIDIVQTAFALKRRPTVEEVSTDRFLPPAAERAIP